ncbi:hypothetical protein [Sorangium sp. So ce1153]|uniref:hypothetical protein n=1 Tax=Sorangium sp. So ce1153 TaxID=3133333 RepID=UPI003F5FE178
MAMERDKQKITLMGRVVDTANLAGNEEAAGVDNATIEVLVSTTPPQIVSAATTDSVGAFAFELDVATLRPILGSHAVSGFFRVYQGSQLLADTRDSLLWYDRSTDAVLRIGVDPAKPEGTGSPAHWTVRGRVTDPNGGPLQLLLVYVFDRNVTASGITLTKLGEAETDAGGFYQVGYTRSELGRAGKQLPDLEVQIYDSETFVTAAHLCHAPATAVVDVVVEGDQYRAPTEYDRVAAAAVPALGGADLEDLDEDTLALVACSAGVDRERLARVADASRMAVGTAIAPEIFYGLLRWGLSANRAELLSRGLPTLREAITWASEERVIPRLSEAQIDAVMAQLKPLVAASASEERTAGAGSFDQLLANTLPASSDRQVLLNHHVRFQGSMSSYWSGLRSPAPLLTQSAVDNTQRVVQLGALTRDHLPLVKKLNEQIASGAVQSLRDLARRDVSDWLAVLDQTVNGAPIGVPAGVPGATTQEKKQNYASVLTWTLEREFPSAALAGRLGTAAPALADAVRFLNEQPNFELGRTRLRAYLSGNSSALSFAAQPAVVAAQLAGMERLHKITPSASEIRTLMGYGLDSAQSVVRMGRHAGRQPPGRAGAGVPRGGGQRRRGAVRHADDARHRGAAARDHRCSRQPGHAPSLRDGRAAALSEEQRRRRALDAGGRDRAAAPRLERARVRLPLFLRCVTPADPRARAARLGQRAPGPPLCLR